MTSGCWPSTVGIRSRARMISGRCRRLSVLVRAACLAGKGSPTFDPKGNMDHKWLLHSRYQLLFGGEDDKRLVFTGCQHSL